MVLPGLAALVWGLLGISCTILASRRNRHPLVWTLLGWTFGIFALGILYFLPPIPYNGPPLTAEQIRQARGVGCLGFLGLMYLWGVVLYFAVSLGGLLADAGGGAAGVVIGLFVAGPVAVYWAWSETRRYHARRAFAPEAPALRGDDLDPVLRPPSSGQGRG